MLQSTSSLLYMYNISRLCSENILKASKKKRNFRLSVFFCVLYVAEATTVYRSIRDDRVYSMNIFFPFLVRTTADCLSFFVHFHPLPYLFMFFVLSHSSISSSHPATLLICFIIFLALIPSVQPTLPLIHLTQLMEENFFPFCLFLLLLKTNAGKCFTFFHTQCYCVVFTHIKKRRKIHKQTIQIQSKIDAQLCDFIRSYAFAYPGGIFLPCCFCT